MKFDMPKRWKWLALIAIAVVAAVVLWLSSGDAPVATTTLHLGQQVSEGIPDTLRLQQLRPVWLELHSDRVIRVLTTNYSVEAHTPAGETNYETSFPQTPQRTFQTPGERIFAGGDVPLLVAVPMDAETFRIKIVLEEYGAFYSGFQGWASGTSAEHRYTRALRQGLLGTDHKGVTTAVWSPWMVRSNNNWMER